ncbi:aspartyl protease family protein [Hymenobacter properus]|uniref:Aspartyl protease family protein n=1 Tax=Hymenobacter properus TaxID=2791026 RepID=A0A931BHJ2_9BACT|nr:aspartyl protease family protein [Hymenobacter properus]MBF9144069.1 aspartyl protease family protein [Hymenobacter properus]MBR7722885.1 aspartyl protease family protein [Microvirga sp. SRT04]
MFLSRLVWLLFFLLLGEGMQPAARAQAVTAEAPFRFRNARRHQVHVPVRLQRNLVVVSCLLNGYGPFNFLLDTGVSTTLITSSALADSLHLRHGERFRVVGAGGADSGLLAYQTDSVRLTLGGVEAPRFSPLVLETDALNLSGYVGVPIHGILGSELFRSFVVALRPEESFMVLHDPATFRAPQGRQWSSLPISLEKGKAYFEAPVELNDSLTLTLKLVLDTGASHALSLETDSDPRLALPARRLPAELGQGLTGTVRGYLGRVAALHLGRYRLHSVLTSYPDASDVHGRVDVPRNGNVGYELLKRFSLIIDYAHQRLLLRPNLRLLDPFEHDMCGIDLLATGPDYHRYLVLSVAPDSPAYRAGVERDEELITINFLPASALSLSQLSRMLRSEDGRLLYLVLRRPNGDLHTVSMHLKRQI